MKVQTIDGRLFLRDSHGGATIVVTAGLTGWSCEAASGTYDPSKEVLTSCQREDLTTPGTVNGTLVIHPQAKTWKASFSPPVHPSDTFEVTINSSLGPESSPPFKCGAMHSPAAARASRELLILYLKGSLRTEGHCPEDPLGAQDFVCTGAGGTYDPDCESIADCRLVNGATGEEMCASQLKQDPAQRQWEADFPIPVPPGDLYVIVQSTTRCSQVHVSGEAQFAAIASS
jgi:hypothetical protein